MAKPTPAIGVRDLRAHLSAYLRQVANGATITVGDRRGRPLARLVPATRSGDAIVLDRLTARGVIQRGVGKPGRARRERARAGSRPVSDLVAEDRR
jgi:prevent-host-death family protein